MSKILGLDVGEKRVGIAIADEKEKVVFPRDTVAYKSRAAFFAYVKDFCVQEGISLIVIGLPLGQDEKETFQSKKIRAFTEKLSKVVQVPIEFQEESYSTKEAEWKMPKYRKKHRDVVAAMVILERYLGI